MSLFAARRDRLRKSMAKQGYDALLVSKFTNVTYRSTPYALTALIAGEVDIEREPQRQGSRRHDALREQEDRAHFAQHRAEQPGGHLKKYRTAKRARQGALEVSVAQRLWGGRVDRAVPERVIDRCQDHAQQVGTRDPAHPLRAAAEHGAQAEPCGQRHHGQCAATCVEHKADAQADDAHAESFGAAGYRVTHPAELRPILTEALACGRPAVIDCPVDYGENLRLSERVKALG